MTDEKSKKLRNSTEEQHSNFEANKEALSLVEKPAYKSKKFLAWLISEILMAAMAIIALLTQKGLGWSLATYMVGIVFVMGITTMWFMGKQAATDIFQRGFAMTTQLPAKLAKKFKPEIPENSSS